MPAKSRFVLTYRDFLTYATLVLLLGTLAAAVARCVQIFPPYLQNLVPAYQKAGALYFLALPGAALAVCAMLTCSFDNRFGVKRAAILALCAAVIPAGAAAMRLGDAFDSQNYVPPFVFFAAFAALAVTVRALIRGRSSGSSRGYTAAILCALPAAIFAAGTAAAGLSSHILFATLLYLFLPIPFCAAAALACIAAPSERTAAALMCLPISVCLFCALRPYGFTAAFNIAIALSIILPAAAVIAFTADIREIRKYKNLHLGEKAMANKVIPGLGVHHIALKAHNFEESLKFYTEGLGMAPLAAWGEGDGRIQMLDIGDGAILELFAGGSENADLGRYIHLAFRCDDVDAAFATAVKAGAKVKLEPFTVPVNAQPKPMTLRVAFVYGPSGEELEFFKTVE
jgi:glyoxylase I family protein